MQYGANVSNELHSGVTHVVAGKAGTAKVNQAQRRLKNVWIVRPEWILDSVYTFQRQPESNYLLLDSDGDGKKKHRLGVLTERRALQGTLSEDESEAEGGSDLEILRSPTDQVKMVLEDDDLEEMDREVAEALGEDGEDLESGVSDLELTEQDREDIGLVEASSSEPFTGKRTREDDESDTGVPRLASKRQRWSRPAGDEEDRLSDSMDYGDFIADPDDEEDPYVQALEKADKEIDDPSPRRRQKRPRTAPRRSVDEDAELDENDEDGSSEDERSRVRKPKSKIREVVDEDELLEMWGDPASRMATATSKPRRTLHAVEPMAATPEDSLASVGDQDWDELAADLDKDLADIGSLSDEDSEA